MPIAGTATLSAVARPPNIVAIFALAPPGSNDDATQVNKNATTAVRQDH
jgi:hypothetical protein